jgi:hypothetical protein
MQMISIKKTVVKFYLHIHARNNPPSLGRGILRARGMESDPMCPYSLYKVNPSPSASWTDL